MVLSPKFKTGLLWMSLGIMVAIAPGCGWMGDQASAPPAPVEDPTPDAPTEPDTPTDPEPAPSDPADSTPSTPRPPTAARPTPPRQVGIVNGVNCDDPQTQADMNLCANEAYQLADADLSRVYQQLLQSLPASDREALNEAETAWLIYRDLNCEFEASLFEGGSIQPLMYYSCMERMTDERIALLQQR
jgi:uncharacterized protein YecT (DUF1311 family)